MPARLLRLPLPLAPATAEAKAWSTFVAACEPRVDVDGLAGGFARDGLMVVRGAIARPVIERLHRRIGQLAVARYRQAPRGLPKVALSPFGPHRVDVDRALEALALDDGEHLPWLARRIAALPEALCLLAGDDVTAAVRRCLRLPADRPIAVGPLAIDLRAPRGLDPDETEAPTRLPAPAGSGAPSFLRLRVAVYDCPLPAGPERFRPGTHRDSGHPTSDEDRAELQHELGEGDLLLADPRVLLRTAANRSDHARCVLSVDCGDALAGW